MSLVGGFDIWYHIRAFWLLWRPTDAPRASILSESVLNNMCWFSDLDFNGHMNNARYLREADFGRFDVLMSTGLWPSFLRRQQALRDCLHSQKTKHNLSAYTPPEEWGMVVGTSWTRFRRSLLLFQKYQIRTKVVGWNDRNLFFEQYITKPYTEQEHHTFPPPAATIYSISYVRVAIVGDVTVPDLLADIGQVIPSPSISPAWQSFLDTQKFQSSEEKQRESKTTTTKEKQPPQPSQDSQTLKTIIPSKL